MHGKISCNNKISFSGFSIIMEVAAFELEVFIYIHVGVYREAGFGS